MISRRSIDRGVKDTGFTLVELLIVVAILGILALLALPAIRSAIETANSAKCLNQLKQIGGAVFLYKADNSGKMMPYASKANTYWPALLGPYLPPPDPTYQYSKIFRCPSDKRPRQTNQPASYTDFGLAGLNGILFGVCSPITGKARYNTWLFDRSPNLENLPNLSKAMMISDIDFGLFWSMDSIEDPLKQSFRHKNGVNCVFADGHVGWLAKTNIPTDPQDVFWNGGNPDPVPLH